MLRVLGLDPGFANTGWAIMDLEGTTATVIDVGVFCTKKNDRKRNVSEISETFDRAREIARFIEGLIERYDVAVVCFESQSPVRNASASAKLGLTYGVIAAITARRNLAVVAPSPQKVKKAMVGRNSATKEEIEAAVRSKYPRSKKAFAQYEADVPASRREHGFDAVAVVVASEHSEVIQMGQRMSK